MIIFANIATGLSFIGFAIIMQTIVVPVMIVKTIIVILITVGRNVCKNKYCSVNDYFCKYRDVLTNCL